MLAIGFAWRRRAGRDEASYFVADRSLNTFWGFLGLSSLTTGGSTTIALAAFVYIHGLAGLWLDLAGALGLLALGLFLARRIRREAAVTLPEIIGRYYGAGARLAAAILVLVSEIVWFALLIEATQVVLTAAFGLSPDPGDRRLDRGLHPVHVPGRTVRGGADGSPPVRADGRRHPRDRARLRARPRRRLPRGAAAQAWSFPVSPTLRAGDILALLVLIGLPHLVGSDVYSKLLSCRDEATARRSALLASVSKVVFGLSVALMALAARAMLPAAPAGETLPRAILSFVPAPLSSLVLVALVATMQTSADVVLLSASAVTVRDILPPVTRRPPPILAARLLSPIYGALGLVVALALNRDVLETLKLGYSIFAAGLILPVLAAFLLGKRRRPPGGAIAAMVAGGAVAAAGRFFPGFAGARDPVLAGTAVNLMCSFLSVAGARRRADRGAGARVSDPRGGPIARVSSGARSSRPARRSALALPRGVRGPGAGCSPRSRHRSFRRYRTGLFLSNVGSWMQTVAQGWLVLRLSDSALVLGLVTFAGSLPTLVFAPLAGVAADRYDRAERAPARDADPDGSALAARGLHVLGIRHGASRRGAGDRSGVANAFMTPSHQSLFLDLVGSRRPDERDRLEFDAVQSLADHRPHVAGFTIAAFGETGCFLLNALSFVAILVPLALLPPMRRPAGRRGALGGPAGSACGSPAATPCCRPCSPCMALAVFGTPAVTLAPLYARRLLDVGPQGLGGMLSAVGVGAVATALLLAWLGDFPRKGLAVTLAAWAFAVSLAGLAASRLYALSLVSLALLGGAMMCSSSLVNTLMQKRAPARLRGRVISLYALAWLGFVPLGNLQAGAVAQRFGAAASLLVGTAGIALTLVILRICARCRSTGGVGSASRLLKKGVAWRYERRGVGCKEARRRRCLSIGEER